MYNHYYPPNYEGFDCLGYSLSSNLADRFSGVGWRAARVRVSVKTSPYC